jgi:four helix bundle protein
MHAFRRLNVWRKSHELTLRVYEATAAVSERRFPGLTGQLREAASAIPAKIVDGAGRDSPIEFAQVLTGALASTRELEYIVLLAAEVGAIAASEHVRLSARVDEVSRMLTALRKTVATQTPPSASKGRPKRTRRAGAST